MKEVQEDNSDISVSSSVTVSNSDQTLEKLVCDNSDQTREKLVCDNDCLNGENFHEKLEMVFAPFCDIFSSNGGLTFDLDTTIALNNVFTANDDNSGSLTVEPISYRESNLKFKSMLKDIVDSLTNVVPLSLSETMLCTKSGLNVFVTESDTLPFLTNKFNCTECSIDFLPEDFLVHEKHHCVGKMDSNDLSCYIRYVVKKPKPVYKCFLCDKILVTERKMKNHYYLQHARNRKLFCQICLKTYCNRSSLNRHKKTHEGKEKILCSVCGNFLDKKYFNVHQKFHEGTVPYACNNCGKTFKDFGSRNKHVFGLCGIRPYSCNSCGERFKHKKDRKSHAVIHADPSPHLCSTCGLLFQSLYEFQKHSHQSHENINHKSTQLGSTKIFKPSLRRKRFSYFKVKRCINNLKGKEIAPKSKPSCRKLKSSNVCNSKKLKFVGNSHCKKKRFTSAINFNRKMRIASLNNLGKKLSYTHSINFSKKVKSEDIPDHDGTESLINPINKINNDNVIPENTNPLKRNFADLTVHDNNITSIAVNNHDKKKKFTKVYNRSRKTKSIGTEIHGKKQKFARNANPSKNFTDIIDDSKEQNSMEFIDDNKNLMPESIDENCKEFESSVVNVDVALAEVQNPLICNAENDTENNISDTMYHLRPKKVKQEILQDDDEISNDEDNDDDEDNAELSFNCLICPKIYTKRVSLMLHYKFFHNVINKLKKEEREPFSPDQNNQETSPTQSSQEVSPNQSSQEVSPNQELKSQDGCKTGEKYSSPKIKKFVCQTCQKEFRYKSSYIKHKIMCSSKAKFLCKLCGKYFTDKYYRDHIHVNVHSGERPYICYICSKAFKDPAARVKHLHIHSGNKPFKCKFCRKRFNRKGDLKMHFLIHAKTRPYYCPMCALTFATKSKYKNHLEILHDLY